MVNIIINDNRVKIIGNNNTYITHDQLNNLLSNVGNAISNNIKANNFIQITFNALNTKCYISDSICLRL